MPATLSINGQPRTVEADSDTPLLYVLRNDLGLRGPKFGCGKAQCGACTVHIGGQPTRSCVLPISSVGRNEIKTLEGLSKGDKLHPLQQAMIDEQAPQCAYCLNGMIMVGSALLATNPNPTVEQVNEALNSNLCRCGAHKRYVKAVLRAAQLAR